MIIDDSDDEGAAAADVEDVEGNAYRENLTSADGFTRGPNGKIKFNKDTKKRRRENEEADGDVEMVDGEVQKAAKTKRKAEPKLGHEFKAKVSQRFSYHLVGSVVTFLPLTGRSVYRELVETSKRGAWIHMRTCPSRRLRRSRIGEAGLVSRANAELSHVTGFRDLVVAVYISSKCIPL